ncbi:MAG: hypothetical protein K2K64_11320 [Muribaculaceae bacterium]|nr:hypothetical protein [Muribaculaceae bacterium]
MKRLILFSLLIAISSIFINLKGQTDHDIVVVVVYATDETDPEEPEEPEGHRTVSLPLTCYISKATGIKIANFSADIQSYVIITPDNSEIIGEFSNENDFIDFLFTLSGEVKIVFITEFSNLIGYVFL